MIANQTTCTYPTKAVSITPSDSALLPPCMVYVGGAGNVAVMPADSTTAVTFTGMPAGSVVPVMVKQVLSTGTTATAMVATY